MSILNPNKTIFALDPATVQHGDIILLLGTPWGHAALCTQQQQLFEAMPEGLHWRLVFSTYQKKAKHIHVLRPRFSLEKNIHGMRVADYAQEVYGQAYGLLSAVPSVRWLFDLDPNGRFFCSQVISRIFMDYGKDLLPGLVPEKVTPRAFQRSAYLEDVSEECTREINSVNQTLEYQSILDAEVQSKTAKREMKMNRRVFEECRKRLGNEFPPKYVYSLQQLWQWLGNQFTCKGSVSIKRIEKAIVEAMESEDYWGFYQRLHDDCRATVDRIKQEASEILKSQANCESLDVWLRCNGAAGFTLPKRQEYLRAFHEWAHVTHLRVFDRLVETFTTLAEDAAIMQDCHRELLAARSQAGRI